MEWNGRDQYLVGVTNKFAAFFDESEDPYELIINAEKEKLKKKTVKPTLSNENKENKVKDEAKNKNVPVKKPAAPKSGDRVVPADRTVKTENSNNFANNRRNQEGGNAGERERGPARGPRSDAPRGERRDRDRDGPRPPRGDGESRPPRGDNEGRPFRGPRQDGESRPFRGDRDRDRQQGSDGEGRPPRRERRDFGGEGQDSDSRPPRRERRDFAVDGNDSEGRSERRGGGGGGPRGRGGRPPGRNYDNRGKREFDRRSGSDRTGVKAVDKRDGAGSFNWDSTKDTEALADVELNVTNQSDEADWDESVNNVVVPPTDKEASGDETVEPPVEDAAPVEEEPRELTLDEYRAMRGQRERPQFDIRKPGEGEDLSQWKNMVEIKKKEAEPETEDDLEIADIPQRVGRQKHVVGIDITFNDTFRGRPRGGRGGGGAGRGGRNRDRDREAPGGPQRRFGGRERDERPPQDRDRREPQRDRGSRQSAPKVDDEKAFPCLG